MMTKKAMSSRSDYHKLSEDICRLLERARQEAARSVNSIWTVTYWEVGRRIVEHEQKGSGRAGYGEAILQRLSADLTRRLGRGFSADNLERMRLFYLYWPADRISASLPRKSKADRGGQKSAALKLSWTHYAREHWTHTDENPPVGLILCAKKDDAVAHYSLEGLPNKVPASEYKTTLPNERKLAEEIKRTKLALDARQAIGWGRVRRK